MAGCGFAVALASLILLPCGVLAAAVPKTEPATKKLVRRSPRKPLLKPDIIKGKEHDQAHVGADGEFMEISSSGEMVTSASTVRGLQEQINHLLAENAHLKATVKHSKMTYAAVDSHQLDHNRNQHIAPPPPPQSGAMKECHSDFCDPDKGTMAKDFCAKAKKGEKCYDECCSDDGGTSCFPGEAMSNVQGKGNVSLAQLQIGDKVLVKSQGEFAYEPVLAFLHVMTKHSADPLRFVTISHVNGAFRASPNHIVFVATASGGSSWSSKLVGKVQVGDDIFVAEGPGATWDSKPSRVLAIKHNVAQSGMYAPLTSSGTIVVDGVIASNYASSSEHKHLSHTLAHAFLLPVRLYHHLGLATMLEPMWKWLCDSAGTTKQWLCHGSAVKEGSETQSEEMHPYLRVMWRGLKLDFLLPSQ